jgi:DNA-binding response OmpR family regulator
MRGAVSRVLIVDDEARIRDVLARVLTREGHSVETAADGVDALDVLGSRQIELVLLDLLMPRKNGLQVLREMRPGPHRPPVIVLSAVDEVAATVQALDAGAVDYVNKPFRTAELLARVRRHLTTSTPSATAARLIRAGDIELDLERRRARRGETLVDLSEREFALLAHLMRSHGRVCTREELLHDVWGLDFDPGSNVVEVCIGRLRRKLADPPIETVRSAGYVFDAD